MAEETVTRPTLAEVRESLLEAGDQLREMRTKPEGERSENWANEMRQKAVEIVALDAEHRTLEATEYEFRGPRGRSGENQDDFRSIGQKFVDSEAYEKRQGANSDLFETRTLVSEDAGVTNGGLFVPRGTPYIANVRQRRLFLRDLLSTGETGLLSIPYIQEVNALANEGGASAVAEGSAKPESTMAWQEQDAPVRTLAVWVPVTNQVIEDAPTLVTYINNRLVYMLKLREENECLNGPQNVAPRISGIMTQANIQTQTAVTGDDAVGIGLGIGKVENVDGEVDGIIMNPLDYWTMVTTRHSSHLDNGYGGSLPYAGVPGQLWDLPVIRTRAMTQGQALVGAFQLGATLFDRMEATIKTTDSHASYFTSNTTVVLAEERIALAVNRPDFFCTVSLA